MNRKPQSSEPWENDAIWDLLDQAPPVRASNSFVDNTVRAARLTERETSWWAKLFTPAPLAGLAAAAAGVTLGFFALPAPHQSGPDIARTDSAQAVAIQEIAETETLIAASDRLDDFSDNELVSLIGF